MRLFNGPYRKAREEFELEYWLNTLKRANGRLREAARLAGVSPATVFRRMKEANLEITVTVGRKDNTTGREAKAVRRALEEQT